MHHTGGRWLVGTVGVVIAIVGLALAWEGSASAIHALLPRRGPQPGTRRLVSVLGWVGNIARGLVFAVIGTLVVIAAVRFEPSKAGGLDEALKTLRDRNDGTVDPLGRRGWAHGVRGLWAASKPGTAVSDVATEARRNDSLAAAPAGTHGASGWSAAVCSSLPW